MEQSKRILSIDFIKVLATIFVLILHLWDKNSFLNVIYYISGAAVPLFFMVSGALILNRENVTVKYILKKVFNIVRLMFLWNIIFVIFDIITQKTFVNPLKYFIGAFSQSGYLWTFWYLVALIIAYLMSPALKKIFKSDNKNTFTFLLIAICVCVSFISVLCGLLYYAPIEMLVKQAFRIWTHTAYFWLGGVIYEKIKNSETNLEKINIKTILIILLIMIVSIITQRYITESIFIECPFLEYCYNNPIIILWNCTLFWLICKYGDNSKVVCYISSKFIKYTLGIYIFHPIIMHFLSYSNFWNDLSWIIKFIVISVLSCVFSYVFNKNRILKTLVTI